MSISASDAWLGQTHRASLSMQTDKSLLSTNWWDAKTALYGSTTVSDTWNGMDQQIYLYARSGKHTFGEGKIENVAIIRSGYSYVDNQINRTQHFHLSRLTSRTLDSKSVPSPAPVPPPRE